jgi:arsenate reductase
MGAKPRDLLRRRGTPYEELGLDDASLGEAALIAAMHEHPILIERPVVRTRKGTRLCRPPERLREIL